MSNLRTKSEGLAEPLALQEPRVSAKCCRFLRSALPVLLLLLLLLYYSTSLHEEPNGLRNETLEFSGSSRTVRLSIYQVLKWLLVAD